eukprot:TRINITY_DN14240_c0_g1_i1.p1 TRINITY_DN14240_c0_g1~~TRINITY_DN14240_c0_g1_i1.p1  ORF type:complete len:479 (-),score=97.33 TRINITY_DN14240_c0_g1_i1:86-1522(-)
MFVSSSVMGDTNKKTYTVDVVVIGAGFCGLAAGAALKTYKVKDFVILEQGTGVGGFWRNCYDRIKLHSAWHSLPYHDPRKQDKYAIFKPKAQLLNYFEEYAADFKLEENLKFNQEVNNIKCLADLNQKDVNIITDYEWEVHTQDSIYITKCVSLCSGFHRKPYIPTFPNQEKFKGEIMHSYYYKNPQRFVGKKMLLIGNGNSAFEISVDLAENGATWVGMLANNSRHVVKLTTIKRLFQVFKFLGMISLEKSQQKHLVLRDSKEWNEEIDKRDSLMKYFEQDLSQYGFAPPSKTGFHYDQTNTGRIAVTDVAAINAIKSGLIKPLRGKITNFTETSVEITYQEDSANSPTTKWLDVDTIILGTGFEPNLESLLDEAFLEVRNSEPPFKKIPKLSEDRISSSVRPSLVCAGFKSDLNGGFGWGIWGWDIGKTLAIRLGNDGVLEIPPHAIAPPKSNFPTIVVLAIVFVILAYLLSSYIF